MLPKGEKMNKTSTCRSMCGILSAKVLKATLLQTRILILTRAARLLDNGLETSAAELLLRGSARGQDKTNIP